MIKTPFFFFLKAEREERGEGSRKGGEREKKD